MADEHKLDRDTLIKIIRAIPSNIFFKDTDQKYVFLSHYSEELGIQSDREIYGKTDRELRKSSDNIELAEAMDKEILETGTGRQYVIKTEVNGIPKYVDIIKEPVMDEDGKTIGIVGLMNDVTMATQELSNMLENEKAYQEAMRAGAFLAYNVNLSKDILKDDLKEIIDGKELNLLDILGMKAPCGYNEFITKWANTTMRERSRQGFIDYHLRERLISLYKSGQSEISQELSIEIINNEGNPELLWINENILLMQNVDKEVMAFITLKNITEERVKEQEMRKQLEEAVEEAVMANKAKDQFLANTSHEIRTPMNAVIGMAEVLLREETDPRKIEYLNNIKAAGVHLLGIINNILDFSKIESGKIEIIPEVYEIRPRLDRLTKLLEERVSGKDVELIFDVDERLPQFMYGDATRIRQVIINLVNNAIKFTEKGFVKVTVRVEEISDTEVTEFICVEDSGIGIKEEEMDQLFGAFNRLDKEKTAGIEGTGLGLTLSKQLVELMGGNIQVESEYGVGTKFFFTIKQGLVEESKIKEKDDLEKKNEQDEKLFKASKTKVLIADDSAVNIKVFKALVAPLEMQIDTAENGKIATELIEKNEYDLVFMDHMMPVMNGIEATKYVRQLESDKRDVLIIALTANAVVGVKEQFIEAGMNDFISKPIQIKELLSVLRKYLPSEYIEEIS